MSQVIEKQLAPSVKTSPTSVTLGYIALVLLPIVLKLLGLTPVAAWPWQKVTVTLWLPWLMTAAISLIGWIVYLVQTRPGRA